MCRPLISRCLSAIVASALVAATLHCCAQAGTVPAPLAASPLLAPSVTADSVDSMIAPAVPLQSDTAPVTVVAGLQPPGTPEEIGDSLMSHQRYQAAIAAYRKEPKLNADIWNKMGIAYQLMFNAQEAEHCYEASLKFGSKNARVLNNLGTIYDSEKEYSNAERMYHRAIKFDPHSAMLYKNLGTNLLSQHKYKRGWDAYKTALEIDPHIFTNNASPRVQNPATVRERGAMNYYMAKGCLRAGMNECAIDYLRMALNEGFTNPTKIQADIEFAGLQALPAFQQLIAEQRQQ